MDTLIEITIWTLAAACVVGPVLWAILTLHVVFSPRPDKRPPPLPRNAR